MDKQALEQRIREGIPISAQMDFRIVELTQNTITVHGGGSENVNVHGTAFAGSLYSICTLALWGLVNSRLPPEASLVMTEGSIRYRKPVTGAIVSHCQIASAEMQDFLESLDSKGRARLYAEVFIDDEKGHAVEFAATVYARIERS